MHHDLQLVVAGRGQDAHVVANQQLAVDVDLARVDELDGGHVDHGLVAGRRAVHQAERLRGVGRDVAQKSDFIGGGQIEGDLARHLAIADIYCFSAEQRREADGIAGIDLDALRRIAGAAG